MHSCLLTPAAGKRLIAKAIAKHAAVSEALQRATIVVVAGTTNGYVAEELLDLIGQKKNFSKVGFYRGVTMTEAAEAEHVTKMKEGKIVFPGDVVIRKGTWLKGKTINDVADELKEGDVILKGANSVNLAQKQAAVFIGHPKGGTIAVSLQAAIGRRVRLILPIGLEKRVNEDLNVLAMQLNAPGSTGHRILPVPGEVVTEIEALKILADVEGCVLGGGGVYGAEGAVWLGMAGNEDAIAKAEALLKAAAAEPLFSY